MMDDDYVTIRELTEKYRGKKVRCRKYDDKYGEEFEAEVSHFTGLRNISVIHKGKLVNLHDTEFVFIDETEKAAKCMNT